MDKSQPKPKYSPNYIPAYFAAIIDIAVTFIYQKKEYWQGDLSQANEGNPIGAFFMANHVSGLFIVCGVWLLIIYPIGKYLPPLGSKIFLLFVVIAHSYGACSWISPRFGWTVAMVLITINTVLYVLLDRPKDELGRHLT